MTNTQTITHLVEFGVLFDFVVLLPALYVLCYRKRKRRTLVRAIGLACLGVWAATKLIPDADRMLLIYLAPVRYVGLLVLILLELAIVRLIFTSLSAGKSSAEVIDKAKDAAEMPEWVARLLVWEAGVWRRLFLSIRRLIKRDRDDV
ncbi:MAG: hypothetical protein AAF004_05990 [Pseudomonadota bacterium]